MNKKMYIIGAVVILIGVVLIGVDFTDTFEEKDVKDAEDLAIDYNPSTEKFESYDKGDTVTFTGKITDKSKGDYGNFYYHFNHGNFSVHSDKDIGDEGDTLTIECEVKYIEGLSGLEGDTIIKDKEYLSVKEVNPKGNRLTKWGISGAVISIIGGILIIGKSTQRELQKTRSSTDQQHSFRTVGPINKKLMTIGCILIVIGIMIASLGFWGFFHKKPEEITEEYNQESGFWWYDRGETVNVHGTITRIKKVESFDTVYYYELDDQSWEFKSDKKIGEVGDTVNVKLELENQNNKNGWRFKSHITTPIGGFVGLFFIFIGCLMLAGDFLKNSQKKRQENSVFVGMKVSEEENTGRGDEVVIGARNRLLLGAGLGAVLGTALGIFIMEGLRGESSLVLIFFALQGLGAIFGTILGARLRVDLRTVIGAFVGAGVGGFVGIFLGAGIGKFIGILLGSDVLGFIGAIVGTSIGASGGGTVGTSIGASRSKKIGQKSTPPLLQDKIEKTTTTPQEINNAPKQQQQSSQQPTQEKTVREKLEELQEMKDKDLIREEDFEKKKDEILDQY